MLLCITLCIKFFSYICVHFLTENLLFNVFITLIGGYSCNKIHLLSSLVPLKGSAELSNKLIFRH